jgi:5-methylcytosine-specific restriction enzyme A
VQRAKSYRAIKLTKTRRKGAAWRHLYDSRWADYSRRYRIANPLCVLCLAADRTRPAEVVDHVRPHRGDADLFWGAENHQSLCKRCHDRKTATEDGGFGRVA